MTVKLECKAPLPKYSRVESGVRACLDIQRIATDDECSRQLLSPRLVRTGVGDAQRRVRPVETRNCVECIESDEECDCYARSRLVRTEAKDVLAPGLI